jgi:hypothetical protein
MHSLGRAMRRSDARVLVGRAVNAALREGHGHLGGWKERFKQAAEAKREPDRAFQKAAREALATERP